MTRDLRDFWGRFQTGVEVAAATDVADKLYGIRDAFRRYLGDNFVHTVPVVVVPQPQDESATPLPLTDEQILDLAHQRAAELQERLGDQYAFYVGCENGLHVARHGGDERQFVRTWSVVLGLGEEAWGSSGSVQLPQRLIHGLDQERIPFAIPGTRRSGGMVASLTGGQESRRTAAALATFHAISTLLYGLRAGRR